MFPPRDVGGLHREAGYSWKGSEVQPEVAATALRVNEMEQEQAFLGQSKATSSKCANLLPGGTVFGQGLFDLDNFWSAREWTKTEQMAAVNEHWKRAFTS
jgi:hypothetical protein